MDNPKVSQADDDPRHRYFVSSWFAAKIRDELRDGLPGVFDHFGLRPYFAEHKSAEGALLNKIRRIVELTRFGLYDLSGVRPNVMIELGMAITLNKPCVLVARKDGSRKPLPDFVQGLDILFTRTSMSCESSCSLRCPICGGELGTFSPRGSDLAWSRGDVTARTSNHEAGSKAALISSPSEIRSKRRIAGKRSKLP